MGTLLHLSKVKAWRIKLTLSSI